MAYSRLAIVAILVYPVGVPVFLGYLLLKHRKNLADPRISRWLGFAYEVFNFMRVDLFCEAGADFSCNRPIRSPVGGLNWSICW